MLKEFKEFISRGNVMDLAVGVVIGGAFQKIVTSLVEDIIMPAISVLTGKIDFSDMMFSVGGASIKYGNFITTIVNFLIISFSIFLVVKYINKLNKIKEIGDLAVNKLNKDFSYASNKEVLFGGEVISLHGRCGGYNIGLALLEAYKSYKLLSTFKSRL